MNVIVDLEHTISNAWHRINGSDDRGIKFQKDFVNDRPNNNIIQFMLQLEMTGSYVIILSAKKYKHEDDVINWLKLHKVVYSQLIMKEDNSLEHTDTFKERIIKEHSKRIDFALDDVGRNCAMFYKNNIPCLRIEQK